MSLIALPPYAEQKRIAAKMEEILPYIGQYDKAHTKLEIFSKKFPEDMKKSILQLAMQWKLVEQRPEEGTADELYKQIAAEKARLVKEGKIKAEKPLPEIGEEEIPFEIPKSWKWVRLRNIVYSRGQKKPNKRFSYIDIGSIDNIHQKLNEEDNIIEADKAPSRARKIVKYGDVLYATVRPYLHNICIIDKEFCEEAIASTGFAVMTCCMGILNKYLLSYLLSPEFDKYANSIDNAKGVAYLKAKGSVLAEYKDSGKEEINIIRENADRLIDIVEKKIVGMVKDANGIDHIYAEGALRDFHEYPQCRDKSRFR